MASDIVIATRQSKLAVWQANLVKNWLMEEHAAVNVSLSTLISEGDQRQDVPLHAVGGKDLFVKNIQRTILEGKAQIAVHSLKDMSAKDHEQLCLAAFLRRGDPRDVLVSQRYQSINALPRGAIVGTSSPRRQSLLHSIRPGVVTKLLRGNVQTRLQKLDTGEYDAIILAAAGLQRLGLENRVTEYLDPEHFIPAIGQGIIVAECKRADAATRTLLKALDDPSTRACATAERAFNQKLNGDCFTPLGAFAQLSAETLTIVGFCGDVEGKNLVRAKQSGSIEEAQSLGFALADAILNQCEMRDGGGKP